MQQITNIVKNKKGEINNEKVSITILCLEFGRSINIFFESFKEFAEDEKRIETKLSTLRDEGRTLDDLSLAEFCRIFNCHSASEVAYIYQKGKKFQKRGCTF